MSDTSDPPIEEADVADTSAAVEGGALLVDVREDFEWNAGHARGAIHLPMMQVPARLDELPRDAPIYLICATGNRSGRVAQFLTGNGFSRPINVRGGTVAWQRAGLPIDREE
ncbi:MAG TPA: rhodanese-like domain-containing protein [Candidatus Limnocylindrales bacterium]|nr:rhodanese-like domain-containing protein [Candidatus Limnocylindrales bacterium]